jgi:spore coat polysaccharide biosynthesis protein SpsF (cytidylyltransferase family)
MRTRVVIQSRLSSSRLPGKALMTVGGMPLIELVARRASRTGFGVVVATSVESYDDRIAAQLEPTGIRVVRGPLDDVLSRFLTATSDMDEADRVVRLTGDNPVTDAALVQELMDAMDATGRDYGRVDIDVVPEGLGVEVFTVALLRRAGREANTQYDREHVTPWIRRHTEELLFAPTRNPGHPAVYRATVDCLHDFTRVSKLFDGFADPVTVHWADIMDGLVGQVRALGPIAREAGLDGRRLTTLTLGVANAGGREREGWTIREVFTRAVEAGMSDVLCAAEDAPLVATGLLPMLKQRLGISLTMPSVADSVAPDLQLRYLLERARAESGHAALRTVFLPESDLSGPAGASLVDVLTDCRERGVVDEAGVLLEPGGTLAPETFGAVAVAAARASEAERLEAWHATGRITVAVIEETSAKAVREALKSDYVDSVNVHPRNRRELTSLLALG